MNVRGTATAAALAALASCFHGPTVDRAYGGNVVEGAAIEPQAYSAFLRGAMAEADGNAKAALGAYEEASREDEDSPEIWTRIGEVTCRVDPRDGSADAAFAHAFSSAPGFPRAEAARSRCLAARGDAAAAQTAARLASQLDPAADGANVLLATSSRRRGDASTRAVLVGLTLTAREPLVAWDALAKWSEAEGDVPSWARALEETVRIDPARRDAVARAAEALAGTGHPSEALAVAAAAADAAEAPLGGGGRPIAARLAIDEAIGRGSIGEVQSRATRVRLSLDEVAGRALLAGERTMARRLASELAAADPRALGARLVLAAIEDDTLSVGEGRPGQASAPSAAYVAFGAALLRATSPARAAATLRRIAHEPVMEGDERVVGPAVELAVRGALPVEELPPDGVVELAARRGDTVPDALMAARASPLDPRHEYLALALAHPDSVRARTLGAELDGADASDPIVAAAAALMRVTSGATTGSAAAKALLARNAGDPLLVATALHVAEKAGDHDVARRAREALTALGAGGLRAVE